MYVEVSGQLTDVGTVGVFGLEDKHLYPLSHLSSSEMLCSFNCSVTESSKRKEVKKDIDLMHSVYLFQR